MAVGVGMASPGLIVVVLLLVTWVPVELLPALYLRDHRTLHIGESKRGPPRGA